MSALTITDRTAYPKDIAQAYEAVLSMQRLPDGLYDENNREMQLDHALLSSFIKTATGERDLSASVSSINEVAKYLLNQFGGVSSSLFVASTTGNVGIGTTTPSHKLEVAGDIAATGFVNLSTREAKKDISFLTGADEATILQKIASTSVATYIYNSDSALEKRLGLIAEESPVEVLSADRKGVDLYKMVSFSWAGIKELASTTVSLQNQINALTATSTLQASQGTISLATLNSDLNLDGFSIINVKSITGMNGLWRIDEGGNIVAQSVETQKLTVGGGAASGVTVYDRATSAPKCIYIEGGVIKTSDGACGATQNVGAEAVIVPASAPTTIPGILPVATSSIPGISTATSTEPIIEIIPEPIPVSTTTPETATSTPEIIILPTETATTTP